MQPNWGISKYEKYIHKDFFHFCSFDGSHLMNMTVLHKNDHWSFPTDHHADFDLFGIIQVKTLVSWLI